MPHAALWLGALGALTGCVDTGPKDDEEPGPTPALATHSEVDVTACTEVPEPREGAHAAWFLVDEPLERTTTLGDVAFERGFVLYGGMDPATDEPRDDLWTFDATNLGIPDGGTPEHALCPWDKITDAAGASGGVGHGALVARLDAAEVWLVGGMASAPGGLVATPEVQVLDLHNLAAGFADAGFEVDTTSTIMLFGDDFCNDPPDQICWNVDPSSDEYCTVDHTVPLGRTEACDNVFVAPADCGSVHAGEEFNPHLAGCAGDPWCAYGDSPHAAVVTVPGRAEPVVLYDPTTQELWVHAGYSGCTADDCSAWEGARAWGDEGGAYEMELLTATTSLRLDLASNTVAEEEATWPDQRPDDWLAGAGFAPLRPVGTPLGLVWGRQARGWLGDGAGFATFAHGGTRWQVASTGHDHVLTETDAVSVCEATYVHYDAAEWTPRPHAGDMGVIERWQDATSALSTSPEITFSEVPGAGDGNTRTRHAIVPIDANSFWAIGGHDSTGAVLGVDQVDIGGGVATNWPVGELTTERVFPTAVFDPVAGRAFVHGGSSWSTTTEQLDVGDDVLAAPGENVTWTPGPMVVTVSFDGTDFTLGTDLEATVQCSVADCVAEDVPLYVRGLDEASLAALTIEVTYEDGWSGRAPLAATPDLTEETASIRARLPRYLTEGESVTVRVRFPAEPRAVPNLTVTNALFGVVTRGPATNALRTWRLAGPPASLGSAATAGDALEARAEVSFEISDGSGLGLRPVGPGATTAGGGAGEFGIASGIEHPIGDWLLYLFEGVAQLGELTDGVTTYTLYVDTGLDPTVQAQIESVFDGTVTSGLSLSQIVAEVESRLGPSPIEDHALVFVRDRRDAAGRLGFHTAGVSLVTAYASDGTRYLTQGDERNTVAHEVAHAWYGEAVNCEAATGWLCEALPELVVWSLDPELALRLQQRAVHYEVAATLAGVRVPLPEWRAVNESTWEAAYRFGPYTLDQLLWTRLAVGLDVQDFWTEWRDLVVGSTYGASFPDADLQAQLAARFPEAPEFYPQWIGVGRVGTPLVAAQAFTPETGTTGRSLTLGSVEGDLFAGGGWTAFSGVPYVLGCGPVENQPLRAFSECGATLEGVLLDTPELVGGSDTRTLTPDPELVGPAMPAKVGIYANWRLLPDGSVSATSATMSGSTGTAWAQVLCDAPTPLGTCRDDATLGDGDGWSNAADCEPDDPGAHPFQEDVEAPTTGDGIDYNCDTWAWPLGTLGDSP